MRFRPCIDIHNGKVKQIVGSSLRDEGATAKENFISGQDASWYARMFRERSLAGGHMIILNKKGTPEYVTTKGTGAVRYIVPQKVNIKNEGDVQLFFRVGSTFKNATVKVSYDGNELISRKRPRLAPGEMENVTIKNDMLKGFAGGGVIEITVEA